MSPVAQALFLECIYPTICRTIPRVASRFGTEDTAELVQDTAVSACQGIESLEARGKEILPSSVAYYAIQRAKSGRRSQAAGRSDVMSPGATMDGGVTFASLDAPLAQDVVDGESVRTLHDTLADRQEDPATIAMRRLDWTAFWQMLSANEHLVVQATAIGEAVYAQAAQLHMTSAAVVYIKRRVAKKARAFWGDDVLSELGCKPQWRRAMSR